MNYRHSLLICSLFLSVTGCSSSGSERFYPFSLRDGLARLDKADLQGFLQARQCGLVVHFVKESRDGQSVSWVSWSSGHEVYRFSVLLKPTDKGLQAVINVPKAADGGEIYDGKQKYTHPALMQPLRPALRELVDSAMDQRPYDWHRLPDPLNIGPNETMTNCGIGQATLARGIPMELSDPPGMPHDVAVNAGLAR